MAALTAGCTRSDGGAPVIWGWGDDRPLPRAKPGPYTVTVQRGDNLYRIAKRNNASLRAVIDANGLTPPFDIRPGQELLIPASQSHTVQKGETVYSISRAYGTNVATLAKLNGIGRDFSIRVGQTLMLPGGAATTTVASRSGSDGGSASGASKPTRIATRPSPAPSSPSLRFGWPVQGPIISSFGSKGGGLHNDGINIRVPAGTPVKAAENGVVVYAGNELRGFGNLLLIRHEGGWVTAYAHNSALLVKRGQKVKRGDTIAKSGASGSVNEPQLHFEIRRGKTPVDPTRFVG